MLNLTPLERSTEEGEEFRKEANSVHATNKEEPTTAHANELIIALPSKHSSP